MSTEGSSLSEIMADATEASIENEIETEDAPPRGRNVWLTLVLPVTLVAVILLGVYYLNLSSFQF